MDDLKTFLRDEAEEMRLDPEMPAGLKTRSRRRRIGNAILTGVIVLGVGVAAFAGARQLVDRPEVPGPRPAQQPPASQELLPIWPMGEAKDIDRIQQEVDEGHQPWYESPEIVASVFAMDVLLWDRDDIEASVRGDDPVTVVISNPKLAETAGAPADLRTILTMERWRDRADGIFVVTAAETDSIVLEFPVRGQAISEDSFTFSGRLGFVPPRGGYVASLHLTELTGGTAAAIEIPGDSPEIDRFVEIPGDPLDLRFASVQLVGRIGPRYPILAMTAFPLAGAALDTPAPEDERLPSAVMETRDAIQVAANDRDWDALEALIPQDGFEYSFGAPEGGPISYWKRLEREGTPVLDILATLLSYSGTEYRDLYLWPTAAEKVPKDWTEADLEPLTQIYSETELEQIKGSDMYYGWRVGIEPNGNWIFFIAGD